MNFLKRLLLFVFSEATQCLVLSSRQGTADTIEEEDDEQEHSKTKKQVSFEAQEFDESPSAEGEPVSEGQPAQTKEEEEEGQEDLMGEDELQEEEVPLDKDEEKAAWESFSPDEGPSTKLEEEEKEEEADSAPSGQENVFISESEDGGRTQDFMETQGQEVVLYTPDTDASKTSDADVPPSYSKAVSFDRLDVSDDESDTYRKRRMLMTSDSRSDSRSDIMLPSMTTELTASELLLNK